MKLSNCKQSFIIQTCSFKCFLGHPNTDFLEHLTHKHSQEWYV